MNNLQVAGTYRFRIKRLTTALLISIILLAILLSHNVGAATKPLEFATFTFENDAFVGNDKGYTNGMGYTYGKALFTEFDDSNTPAWLQWLTGDWYISTMKNKQRGIAHMFFQRMQTPQNLGSKDLIKDDLPYAGLLAWQGTMYTWDTDISDQLSIYLGVVGPVALAKEAQTLVHSAIGSDKPMGWDNQIKNEPVFKFEAQRVWNLYWIASGDKEFDILGLAGAGIGTLESATKAGFAIRWGTNLKSSFATFSLQADRQVNPLALSKNNDFYLFFGIRGGFVFNDILVDGNYFTDSHSVPLKNVQDQASLGAVWGFDEYALVFQFSSQSSRTTIIDNRENFGALSLTYRF